jgi:serpin B
MRYISAVRKFFVPFMLCLALTASAHADDATDALAKSNNAFAFDLYAKLRGKAGNLAFSPFSIDAALTMTWMGAKGKTAEEMQKVLHASTDAATALAAIGKLTAAWGDPKNPVTLRVANRLFGEKSAKFEKAFTDGSVAPLEPVDFKGAAEAARAHINDWVAKQTNDRIKDLLPPKSLNPMTRLVLVNAVYFLADWTLPFKKEATTQAPFFVDGTKSRNVDTMHAVEYVAYAEADGAKVIELTYKGNTASMVFVLPDAKDGLGALEKKLSPEVYGRWLQALQSTRVAISLPKFTIDSADPISLADDLGKMGMPTAFTRGKADFTAISNPPTPDEALFIAQVFHKAFVKVDEKGTEAAAATAVVMEGAGAAPSKPKEFNADHPFLFVLRDRGTGAILFMGRVDAPSPG